MHSRIVGIAMLLAACSGKDEAATGDTSPTGGGLTEDAFADQFLDRYCQEWATCTTTECPFSTGGTTETQTAPCDFDPVAAQACLDGTFTCNTDFPGYEFVETPPECASVCGEGTGTTPQ